MKHRIQFLRRRREFITLLSGAVAMWPLAARAQHAKHMPRIGILTICSSGITFRVDAPRQGLRDLGHSKG